MNIFDHMSAVEAWNSKRLGTPAMNVKLRLVVMEHLTGGKGFRQEPKTPKVDLDGKTRRERKLALRALTRPKYDEPQPIKFWNSKARRAA
jgi:hypothetical protein